MKVEESLLANVKMAPRDAILGLTELYVADSNPKKVNLGVGVYYDDQGKLPLLECVRNADQALAASGVARPYLAMDGFPDYVRAVQGLLFGKDHPAVAQGRVTTVQAVGGTGGLKVGADFIRPWATDRKSTRLNSSHEWISYAVFCLKRKSSNNGGTRAFFIGRMADPPSLNHNEAIATS